MQLDCSNCGSPIDRNGRYCRRCHNAYMRRWRAAGRVRKTAEHVRREAARGIANVYLGRGKIERRTACERCGSTEHVEKHHPDYDEPLRVQWLCRVCHELEPRDNLLGVRAPHRPLD